MPVKSLGRGKSTKASKKKTLTRKKNNTKRKGNKRKTRNQKGGWWPSWLSKLTQNDKYNIAIERASKLPLGSRIYSSLVRKTKTNKKIPSIIPIKKQITNKNKM
jgi:hypothetical protein